MAHFIDTQLANVACYYAGLTNCKITNATLKKDLEENPFYPSLLSLTKTFNKYSIPSKAFKLDAADFHRLSAPFLALIKIKDKDDDFVLVTAAKENTISFIYEKRIAKTVPKDVFLTDFKGVVWMAEPTPESGERDYKAQLQKERSARYKSTALLAGAVFVLSAIIYANIEIHDNPGVFGAILLLKIVGCCIAIVLLLYKVDKNNSLVKNICAVNANKKINCDAVLNSKASKILWIDVAEIGFFYFSSTTLVLLLPVIPADQKLSWLAAANFCAIPYILFSLYYQWRIVKQWCKLCLATQTVLAAELCCFLLFPGHNVLLPQITASNILVLACCILLPVVLWYWLKPFFIRANGYKLYYPAFQRLRNAPDIFNMQLQKQKSIHPGWENTGMATGTPEGKTAIVMVSNLFCAPCARAHAQLHDLARQNKNVKLHIILINENTEANKGELVTRHLMALADTGGNFDQALTDWYLNRDYDTITGKYPVPEKDLECQSARLKKMYDWCTAADIAYTPAIFINGCLLPTSYSPDDLKNIL